jgi:hypothetical protein
MANTKNSVELIYRISEHLNQIIRNSGQIQINNKQIWNEVLHQLENSHWRGILETLEALCDQNPNLGNLQHRIAISQGLAVLEKYEAYYDRCMDVRTKHLNNKGTAWKCLMTMRELYTTAIGENLPNADTSKVRSTYEEIFE